MATGADVGPVQPEVASFRDPAGQLIQHGSRILRILTPEAAAGLRAFLETPIAAGLEAAGRIVKTNPAAAVPRLSVDGEVYEHERVPFPSYPYEWPPEMLHAAAAFTLDLCEELLPHGYWLKDASPYNVLFRGPEPVFVDIPSFERRDPLNQTWLPYSQFVRTFLLVLLAARRLGRRTSDLLLTHREGPEPAEIYEWAGWLQRLSPGFLGPVSLPVWFDRRRNQDEPGLYTNRPARSAEQAEFVLRNLYGGLRRSLRRVTPAQPDSTWTDYLHHKSLYSPATLAEKAQFVREALKECRPEAVLDVGCNEGHFSRIAAESGARVVAIDYDPAVAGRVWRCARAEKLDILPLVVDLTRPTPGIGWRNQECASFLDRARGHFDLVMMLAVIHHMTVTERIPLAATLELAASMTRTHALIEFVGPEDPMFRRLVRGRDLLYRHLTVDEFEREAGCFFNTIRIHRLPGLDRWLFLLGKK